MTSDGDDGLATDTIYSNLLLRSREKTKNFKTKFENENQLSCMLSADFIGYKVDSWH